jgi:hypothetical protein
LAAGQQPAVLSCGRKPSTPCLNKRRYRLVQRRGESVRWQTRCDHYCGNGPTSRADLAVRWRCEKSYLFGARLRSRRNHRGSPERRGNRAGGEALVAWCFCSGLAPCHDGTVPRKTTPPPPRPAAAEMTYAAWKASAAAEFERRHNIRQPRSPSECGGSSMSCATPHRSRPPTKPTSTTRISFVVRPGRRASDSTRPKRASDLTFSARVRDPR